MSSFPTFHIYHFIAIFNVMAMIFRSRSFPRSPSDSQRPLSYRCPIVTMDLTSIFTMLYKVLRNDLEKLGQGQFQGHNLIRRGYFPIGVQ